MIGIGDSLAEQLTERDVTLEITDACRTWLAEQGYDEVMGARPLRRLIQDKIRKQLAEDLLFGELREGGHVLVDEAEGELTFQMTPQSGT